MEEERGTPVPPQSWPNIDSVPVSRGLRSHVQSNEEGNESCEIGTPVRVVTVQITTFVEGGMRYGLQKVKWEEAAKLTKVGVGEELEPHSS